MNKQVRLGNLAIKFLKQFICKQNETKPWWIEYSVKADVIIASPANCYGKIKEVTEAIQNAMNATHGLKPIENDVFPVFKGEKINTEDGFFEVCAV